MYCKFIKYINTNNINNVLIEALCIVNINEKIEENNTSIVLIEALCIVNVFH